MALITPMAMAEDTSADVGNLPPYICCKWEEDSEGITSNELGFHVSPVDPDVTIKACICDPNADPNAQPPGITDEIASVTATVTDITGGVSYTVTLVPVMSGGCPLVCVCPLIPCDCTYTGYNNELLPCYLYEATLTMGGCDPSGDYTVTVVAEDVNGGVSDPNVNTFFYDEAVVPEIRFSEVDYGAVVIDEHKVVGMNNEYEIHNAGNKDGVVTITGTKMTHAQGFPTVDMKLDASIGNEINKPLPHTFLHVFECCVWTSVEFSIKPPAGLPVGMYTGTITISMS